MRYRVYTDGPRAGIPALRPSGSSWRDESGRTVYESSKAIGVRRTTRPNTSRSSPRSSTSRKSRIPEADFHLDSELVVKQILGQYRVKEPRLQSLHGQAVMLLNAVPTRTIRHIPRARNARADELANEALDAEGTSPLPGDAWPRARVE
jgi:ribonuclease HI